MFYCLLSLQSLASCLVLDLIEKCLNKQLLKHSHLQGGCLMIKLSHLNKYFNKGKSNEIHVLNDTIDLPNKGLVVF